MSDRKAEILETTAALLRRKSFSSFSYQDLADALGIRKASIHHHFKTKVELALALLDDYRDNARRLLETLRRRSAGPGAFLRGFLRGAEAVMLDGAHRVCPHGAFEEDAQQLPASVTERLVGVRRQMIETLARALDEARQAGEARFEGEPAEQAMLIFAALEGGRSAARSGDRGPFRAVVRQLERNILGPE